MKGVQGRVRRGAELRRKARLLESTYKQNARHRGKGHSDEVSQGNRKH